jgi:hypothetical protein
MNGKDIGNKDDNNNHGFAIGPDVVFKKSYTDTQRSKWVSTFCGKSEFVLCPIGVSGIFCNSMDSQVMNRGQ